MKETVHLRIELDTADHRVAKILAATRGVTLRNLIAELIRREAAAEAATDQPKKTEMRKS